MRTDTFFVYSDDNSGTAEMRSRDDFVASVTVIRSIDDGAIVVQIDTGMDTGRLRVNVNDGEIFDRDPEEA